ncbi:protein OXIDATIVE STRESS 3-like [Gastrolobium bilobum]|uniref:protein OXIDATIVE STRESS 3-like n=1 Tax=Gastrolobium bilobum TaxID=150636 RepID=UPI002AB2A624|nr:protein OXIDATIVE STRESS 3-like [Gastrolobium bilobum]
MEHMENKVVYHTIVDADNKGTVDDECDLVGSFSSSESDSIEEVASPSSSSSSDQLAADPLSDMSSLFQQLPINRRGLSKYYQGKAQSFTSLAKVRSLEDLAKPENPYNKRLKSCRSYGGGMGETQRVKCSTPS